MEYMLLIYNSEADGKKMSAAEGRDLPGVSHLHAGPDEEREE